ncbi:IS3 family transposase, partial [Halobacillus rhizosphaerae]
IELEKFIINYNHKRIKSKLRMSPVQYREKLQEIA